MKFLLTFLLAANVVHANVDRALQAADDLDNSYADTIEEGDYDIEVYKSFTVYMDDAGNLTRVVLINDYTNLVTGKKSVMKATQVGEDVAWVDAITGKDL